MKKIMILLTGSFFLFSCTKKEACQLGFLGDNCDIQETPASITINSAELLDYPDTKADGSGWDDASGPDIYFKLLQNGAVIYTSDIKTDVAPGSALTFTTGLPVNVSNVDDSFTIEFYDDDSALGIGFQDLMGAFPINLYTSDNGFPEEIILSGGTSFDFTMHVDYNF